MCGTCCASRICHLLFSKPHLLEYDAVVWNLPKLGDITKLEAIQKAIHFVYRQFDRDSPSPFSSLVFVPFKAKLHASDFLVTATSDRFWRCGGRFLIVACRIADFSPARKFRLSPGSSCCSFCFLPCDCSIWQEPVHQLWSIFTLATCSPPWQEEINGKVSLCVVSLPAKDKILSMFCHYDQFVLALLGLRRHRELKKCFDIYLPGGATAFHAGNMECIFTDVLLKLELYALVETLASWHVRFFLQVYGLIYPVNNGNLSTFFFCDVTFMWLPYTVSFVAVAWISHASGCLFSIYRYIEILNN